MNFFAFLKKNKIKTLLPKRGERARYTIPIAISKHSPRKRLDHLLPEKRRARRRLMVALALMLAGVIVALTIFEPKTEPDATKAEIQILGKAHSPRPING